ncbi:MAG TPA: rhodanese family protein [Povalibacter sp.]
MPLQSVSPMRAKQLIDSGALLIDIREPDEHAREHIPQAQLRPVSALHSARVDTGGATQVIFHCRSGGRTKANAARLSEAVQCEAFVLEGGLDAWKKAGLPVNTDRSQPLEMMRQVQLAAGSAVVLGVVLGATVSPWLYGLAGFVGAGLVFAGATGFCGLAHVLRQMPWNRRLSQ